MLFVTDIHGSDAALRWLSSAKDDYDALIVGGDVTTWGREDDFERFLSAIGATPSPAYFVPGNHEKKLAGLPGRLTQLHRLRSKLGGFTIAGLGGSNFTPFSTPFEIGDDEARVILSSLGSVDILVSHCPPAETKCDLTDRGTHVGSAPVREYIETRKPTLTLCGHVHESVGTDLIGRTKIVNPGPLMHGMYAALDVGERIDVQLKSERFRTT